MLAYYSVCKAVIVCLVLMLVASTALAEPLSLGHALDMATQNNPTIAAAGLSAKAARQSANGAHALTNPEILVAPSVVGDAGSDSALLFSQPLELNGSRRVRGSIASSEAAAVGFDTETTRRDVILRTTQTYWDVAQAQELVKLDQENVGYLETIRAAVQRQCEVGTVPEAQVMKMDVELARARQELAQAQLGLSQSKAALNTIMNRRSSSDFSVSDPLVVPGTVLDINALQMIALARRPEISSEESRLAVARGQVSAARLLTVPDIALQARKESFSGEHDYGVALVAILPVLDWGSAREERHSAASTVQSREKRLEAVRNEVSLEVEQASQQVATAAQIVSEYQGGILDKSERLAAMAKKGYERGANNYLEVLEAQRTLRSAKSAYYSALAEHARSLARLEWTVGCPLATIGKTEVKK